VIFTAAGNSAGIDMVLFLIGEIAGPEMAEFYQVIKQFRWVARARAVVELSGLVERRPEWRYFMPLVAAPPTKYFWPAT